MMPAREISPQKGDCQAGDVEGTGMCRRKKATRELEFSALDRDLRLSVFLLLFSHFTLYVFSPQ
jgi:hypothetical protein